MKSILIFSYNPVPTDEYKTVEGSALRFWRMAHALKAVGYEDITIAMWKTFPQKLKESDGIKITNFSDDSEELSKLVSRFDVVIFTSAMGDLSLAIYEAVGKDTKIISDAYSPMYVEFLTKSSDKNEDSQLAGRYREHADAFSKILITADHILVGNDNQKHFYRGVLGGLNALPDHEDSRFIKLPAFVEKSGKVTSREIVGDRISVLWFGGVYPWFDIAEIVKSFADERISKKATLTIVGGSNPFYPKDSKRYNGKYNDAVERANKYNLIESGVVRFEDWVDYDERINMLNKHDIAISVNAESIENEYSFRLRVADLSGNGVPIITNGGDVLGEWLIAEGAGFKVDIESSEKLTLDLLNIFANPALIKRARRLLRNDIYENLHIESHIANLAKAIDSDYINNQRSLAIKTSSLAEITNEEEASKHKDDSNIIKDLTEKLERSQAQLELIEHSRAWRLRNKIVKILKVR